MKLPSAEGSRPWLIPAAVGSVDYGKVKEGVELLVWKSYDWWGSVDRTEHFSPAFSLAT